MSNTVSLYVAADSTLQAARNLIQRETVSASNVKSQWTRQETQSALRRILRYLDELREIPKNGLVLFASSSDLEIIEPPTPCRMNVYKCGSEFYKEPLMQMYDEAAGPKTGFILIDTNESTVGWYRGETFVSLWHDYSGIPGKHRMGGQSSQRFSRGHEEQRKEWWRKVADKANEIMLPLGIVDVLVGGPAHIKHDLVEDGVLDYRLRVIGFVSHGYVDDVYGPRECLEMWRRSKTANL